MDNIANQVINLADKHFGEYRIRSGQLIPRYCPFCKGGKSGDQETFAVGLYNGMYNCRRGNCQGMYGDGKGKEGNFQQLTNYFGEASFSFATLPVSSNVSTKKHYDLPNPDDLMPITDKIVTYFGIRGISEKTLEDWKIASDKNGNIVFPFYRDKKLVYVKYRQPRRWADVQKEYIEKYENATPEEQKKMRRPSKEWQMSNTEPILYGMDNVSFNKPLVITEGEIDALSMYEAGVHNVVSVPCGCDNMEWINLCWDWLEHFQQIILFGDTDEPGLKMISTLMKRLGEDRCMVPQEYPELILNGENKNRLCKDANEILACYGPEGLKALVDACEPVPIKGTINVGRVEYIDPTQNPRILTGINALDQIIGGLYEGGVTVLSGRRGEGKSTIGNSILLNAIQQGYKCGVYSGELPEHQFCEWLYNTAVESKYIGYKTDPQSGKNHAFISRDIWERVGTWLDEKMYLYDNKVLFEEDPQTSVLKLFEIWARRYGCKLFLIDNLMSLLITGDEENKAQAKFMSRVKTFATKYKVHVLCVCHPRKEKEGTTFTNDSVSGSSVLTNLADTVLSIEKPNVRVTKNRSFGTTGLVLCDYDPANRRIFQKGFGDRIVYGWDHNGIQIPENQANKLEEFQLQSVREQPF